MCNTQQRWKEIQNSNPTKKNKHVCTMYVFVVNQKHWIIFFLFSKNMLLNKDQIL